MVIPSLSALCAVWAHTDERGHTGMPSRSLPWLTRDFGPQTATEMGIRYSRFTDEKPRRGGAERHPQGQGQSQERPGRRSRTLDRGGPCPLLLTAPLLHEVPSYGELGVLARPKLQPQTTAAFVKL